MLIMELILMIAAISLTASILVYTIIFRYTTLRSVKVITTLIGAIISLPLLGVSLYVLFSKIYATEVHLWAVGIIGLLLGFWLKRPFNEVSQA
jgi:hypothetical protein